MNILLTPCFSMRSYSNDTWLLSRDGHYTKLKAIAYYIKKIYPNAQIDMMIPSKSDVILTGCDLPLWFRPIVHEGYKKNVAEQRLDTTWQQIFDRPKYDGEKYDLIINGNIEYAEYLSNRFSTAVLVTTHTHGPLLTPEYLSTPGNIEGLKATDVFLYNGTRDKMGEEILRTFGSKMHPIYNFVDARTLTPPRHPHRSRSVLFMSRLTDPSRFNIDKMLSILQEMAKTSQVYFTDPSESAHRIEGLIYMRQHSKSDFIEILDKIDTVVVPYSNEVTYSTSYFEAVARGKRVISFRNFYHFKSLNGVCSIDSLDEIPDAVTRPYDEHVFWEAEKHFYIDERWVMKLLGLILDGDAATYRGHYPSL